MRSHRGWPHHAGRQPSGVAVAWGPTSQEDFRLSPGLVTCRRSAAVGTRVALPELPCADREFAAEQPGRLRPGSAAYRDDSSVFHRWRCTRSMSPRVGWLRRRALRHVCVIRRSPPGHARSEFACWAHKDAGLARHRRDHNHHNHRHTRPTPRGQGPTTWFPLPVTGYSSEAGRAAAHG